MSKAKREYKFMAGNGSLDAAYGLSVIGAMVYYVQQATSFWGGVLGILKAAVWPAFLMYKLLEHFKL